MPKSTPVKTKATSAKVKRPSQRQILSSVAVLLVIGGLWWGLSVMTYSGQCFRWPGTAGSQQFSSSHLSFQLTGKWYQRDCLSNASYGGANDSQFRGQSWTSFLAVSSRWRDILKSTHESTSPSEPKNFAEISATDESAAGQTLEQLKYQNSLVDLGPTSRITSTTLAGQPAMAVERTLGPNANFDKVWYIKEITVVKDGRRIRLSLLVNSPTLAESQADQKIYVPQFERMLSTLKIN